MIERVLQHAQTLIDSGTDHYGPKHTPMFMATLDPNTGEYPIHDERPASFEPRAYRFIFSPRGCSAYWDQPTLKALYLLSEMDGDTRYKRGADDYLKAFFETCVSPSGLFFWGNHYYYHAFDDVNVWFGTKLAPVDPEDQAPYHELRPIAPEWDAMHRINPEVVEREIRAVGELHLFDQRTGGFNRHADQSRGCAFLETGGIIAHALSLLYQWTKDPLALQRAQSVAEYSFSHRNHETNLLINNPTETRWDSRCTTTEVGHWARHVMRAAEVLKAAGADNQAKRLRVMALSALEAYARYGYDPETRQYFGQLALDGSPILDQRETIYQPDNYSDVWGWLFPTHDYPMSMAMAMLDAVDEDPIFVAAARNWAEIALKESETPIGENTRYAENYGRLIVFLAKYAHVMGDERHRNAAMRLANEAVALLWKKRLFVGNTRAEWYDAIDGVGYLMLAIIYLTTDDKRVAEFF